MLGFRHMPVRLLTIAIVLFWTGSVGWLCAVVWAPPESRMARIDPLEVYRVFFGWNDSANMTLLENGVRRGQITVAGGSGDDGVTGIFSRVLSVSGSVERFDPLSASNLVDLFWKGSVDFSADMEMQEGEFSVRIPNKELTAHLAVTGKGEGFKARVLMAGREIVNYDSASPGAYAAPGAEGGVSSPLMALGAMGGLGAIPGLEGFNPAAMKLETEARMGNFNFGGRDMRAFLLRLRNPEQGQELRVYLSEVGEPLKIESDLGFEAISEILVPLDAYKRDASQRLND